MPNKDGTGPKGEGSKTGRQLGNCEGAKQDDCLRGQRRGQGRRMGCERRNRMQNE